ncbi:MAG: TonB-dependent receptor plug domain-containing protein [Caulobacteraceae bacterium]|nr:TonB-dependent receptor plug domain-containing protein [Caulobacteraceae bacterium]
MSTLALLSGASLAAFGALSPAIAQDDPETSDEIVVTATGRQAALQDVPLAVTAVSGEQLENAGVQDLRDLTQLAPSFEMGTGQSSAATTARIRGIGHRRRQCRLRERSWHLHRRRLSRALALRLADLPDMERVEILRAAGHLFAGTLLAGAVAS